MCKCKEFVFTDEDQCERLEMKLKSNEELGEEFKKKKIVDSEIRDYLGSKGAKVCAEPKKMLSTQFAKLSAAKKRRKREDKSALCFSFFHNFNQHFPQGMMMQLHVIANSTCLPMKSNARD